MPTIGEWRERLRCELHDISSEFAATDADAILGEVVSANPTQLTLRYQDQLTPEQETRLVTLLQKRLSGAPLGYVLGHVEFFGLDFLCDERVLIPRPDTEEVVHVALRALPSVQDGVSPFVIDVGTGSGNIAIAIAHTRRDVRVIATDVSSAALEVARANCRRHNLTNRVYFMSGTGLKMLGHGTNADLIVGNPPYIGEGDPEVQRSVHDFEPHVALYSGPQGTEILAELIRDAPRILKPGGALICEIGHRQALAIRRLVSDNANWGEPVFYHDSAGVDRVLEVHRSTM